MTATLAIGPLRQDHRPQVEAIVRATGVFSDAEVAVALELFDATFPTTGATASPSAHASDYEFVGAFSATAVDSRLVGYACFGVTPCADRTYDLYWIAVHPSAQRTGAGSALMAEVERRLAARHARLAVVETSSRDDYAPTRQFYLKRGYEEAARLRDFYAPADDRILLTRRLPAAS